jgi:ATP-dependent helicase/nuclease subunit B
MSLRFIIGRAGTGKSRFSQEDIVQRLKQGGWGPLIYLVPEQATFHTEKSLLEHSGLKGTMRIEVLSFQRLAWRVLQETGGSLSYLERNGKNPDSPAFVITT